MDILDYFRYTRKCGFRSFGQRGSLNTPSEFNTVTLKISFLVNQLLQDGPFVHHYGRGCSESTQVNQTRNLIRSILFSHRALLVSALPAFSSLLCDACVSSHQDTVILLPFASHKQVPMHYGEVGDICG